MYRLCILLVAVVAVVQGVPEPHRRGHGRREGRNCDDRPFACPAIYRPVCGSDGTTYANHCTFRSAKCDNEDMTATRGACETDKRKKRSACGPRICTSHWAPVCGTDGKTYATTCTLEGAKCENPNLAVAYDGECNSGRRKREARSDSCRVACPMNYAPVCGTDGKTYSNRCALDNAKCRDSSLRVDYTGQCRGGRGKREAHHNNNNKRCRPSVCEQSYFPVCGTDRKTYSNTCALNNAKCRNPRLRRDYNGECRRGGRGKREANPDGDSCDFACFALYAPVCGTDGKTYGNRCNLNAATCRDSSIQFARGGEC